jgi:hypothetical protein
VQRVLLDPGESDAAEPTSPERAVVALGVRLGCELLALETLGGAGDDLDAPEDPKRRGATERPRLELKALLRGVRAGLVGLRRDRLASMRCRSRA